ncbi:MAG: hydroxymethylbilane synthase, partial [Bacteroidia bacterium]|nr:hydroxymethylbilane synthase [Bacteroidia bacterium]
SNLLAYTEKNKIKPTQKIIAMGDSTGKELEKLKIKNYIKPNSFDDLGLVQAVLSV